MTPRAAIPLALGCISSLACGTHTLDLLPKETSESGGNSSTSGGRSAGASGGATAGGDAGGGTRTSTDPSGGGTTTSTAPNTGLLHRYDFSGKGTTIADLAGDSPAEVLGGASLDDSGQLSIEDGVSYVKLESWILSVSGVSSVTIAVWLTWQGGASWQRIFDFGAMEDGGGTPGNAIAQFYMTPKYEPGPNFSTVLDGNTKEGNDAAIQSSGAFPEDVPAFVAVVVEGDEALGTSTLRLYLDGVEVGTPSTAENPSDGASRSELLAGTLPLDPRRRALHAFPRQLRRIPHLRAGPQRRRVGETLPRRRSLSSPPLTSPMGWAMVARLWQ
ncbi:MAG: hypothetical protein QM784_29875 [Polyangiaceae bacterium]